MSDVLYTVHLPMPPSVNSLYGGGSGQQRFMSKRYKAWIASCPQLPQLQITQPICVEYVFAWPDKRLRDLQNFIKAPMDYMVKSGVIADDNYTIVSEEKLRHVGVDKHASGVTVIVRNK